jgi:hypothetical protein
MRTVVISVNNKVVDFFPEAGFDIAPLVFKRLFNAQTLDQVSGNFTLNFKLPLTEKNRQVFEFIDQNDNVKSFGDLQILKCSITADSDLIIKGTLTINAITDKAYEVTLIGDNIDWAGIFKQRSLRDITSFRKPIWSGARSSLFNPWGPNQYPNSVGYGDLYDDTLALPIGQMEDQGGDYDFAMPLISYGNFKYPSIKGFIGNNFLGWWLNVQELDANIMPTGFPYQVYYGGQSVTLIGQLVGSPGGIGLYQTAGTPADYGSTSDLKDFFLIDDSLYQFEGVNNGYWFYNNPDFSLDWNDIKPAPYLVTTVKRMFQDLQYNVGGDFFSNPKYKNIIIPFVNNDYENKIEPWNYQVMARLNAEFTQTDNGQVSTYNWIRFNNGENSQAFQFPGSKRVQIIRPNYTTFNPFPAPGGNLENSWTPATLTLNENYMYEDTFFKFDSPGVNQQNAFQSYTVPKDGTYNLTYTFRQFGAKNFTVGTQNDWYTGGIGSEFHYMFVKREINSNDFAGSLGQGLVFWDGGAFVTDPDVIYDLPETIIGNPFYNNMDTTPQDKTITTTVDLKYGEVIEFMVAICGFGNPGPYPAIIPFPMDDKVTIATGNQQLTIEKFSTSQFIVEPVNFEEELNPAAWLPDVNQADFLKSVINSFNLFVSYDDQNNRIDINEFENNFLPSGTAQDFTENTSIDFDVKKEPLDRFKQVLFNEVIDESDVLDLTVVPTETYTNNLNNFTEIKNINLLWTDTAIKEYRHVNVNGTLVYPGTPLNQNGGSTIPIPTMSTLEVSQANAYDLLADHAGYNDSDINFNIRLLRYEGLKPYYSNANLLWIEDAGYDGFYPPLSQNKIIPQATTLNILNYVDNWSKWLSLIENNVLYTVKAKLLTRDIAQIDIRKPIQIGNRTFIINSIEGFNVLEDKTTTMKIFKKK